MKTDQDVDPVITNPINLQRGEPLAQTLRTIRVTGVLASRIAIGSGNWAASIPHPTDCIILYIVTQGSCVGGTLQPRRLVDLNPGDALLLPLPGRCLMAKDASIPPVPLEELLRDELGDIDGVEAKWKSLFVSPFRHAAADAQNVSVAFTALRMFFDHDSPSALLDGLPAVIHLPKFAQRNETFVDAMLSEIATHGGEGLSGQMTATRLAEALLVKVLSEALGAAGEERPGFYRGLKDPYLSKIIGAVQNDPRSDWTLLKMSSSVGLSRSALAGRFKTVMGMAPAQFVTAVRMARAADILQHGTASIASIADMTGYSSEAAFNRAFRKWSGTPPGALRRLAAGTTKGAQPDV
ncbi:AraC family transcriptional regulator [Caulobacter soli]|uniref:AraC family transcriptional regulator n=1 Tax=Caulobacter soli TaxID=2708539 RepID=UPI0013EE147C|nr:AraC family transcriptional regulator [Caulobacter soli]